MARKRKSGNAKPRPPGYLEQSRSLVNSLLLVIPLLVLYEAALFGSGFQFTNQFDFASWAVAQLGFRGLLVFNALLFVTAVAAVAVLNRRRKFDPAVLPGILMEGLAYAVMIFTCVSLLRSAGGHPQAAMPLWLRVGLAAGAGVYEELFFRLVLTGLLYAWLQHTVGWKSLPSAAFALVFSSVLFSLSHFNFPAFDDFKPGPFAFRCVAGMILGGLFLVRGLGVAVYTHAIYNVLVLLKPS